MPSSQVTRYVRVLLRVPPVFCLIGMGYLFRLAVSPWTRRNARWNRATRTVAFRIVTRGIMRLIRLQVGVEGPLPRRPFLLVTNHLGYIDIVVLSAVLQPVFVAKADIRSWPLLGAAVHQFDTVFLARERKKDILRVNDRIREALKNGEGVLIFAEGTSSGGDGVLPLKPGLLQVAIETQVPVYYACIAYRTPAGEPPARESVCWWGGMTFSDHLVRLLGLPRIEGRLVFGSEPVTAANRKELAGRLRGLIASQLEQVHSWRNEQASNE